MGEDGDEMILREELLVQMLYLNISYICLFLIIYPGGIFLCPSLLFPPSYIYFSAPTLGSAVDMLDSTKFNVHTLG